MVVWDEENDPFGTRRAVANAQQKANAKKNKAAEKTRLGIEADRLAAQQANQTKMSGMGFQGLQGGVNQYGVARPDYMTNLTATGTLDPRFTQQFGDVQTLIKNQVMSDAPTKWAQLQAQGNQNNYNTGVSSLDQNNASQLANARSMMAMRGGLGGGASERLAGMAMKNNMFGRQGLGRDLANQNLQTSIQDQTFKNQGLAALGAAEQGMQQNNITNLMNGLNNMNAYNQGIYSEDMKAWAADKTADAQKQAAKGGK